MKNKAIRLGVAGALTALSLAAVAVPAHAAACGPVIQSVKICSGDDGRPYPVQVDKAVTAPVPGIGGALMVGNTLTVFDGAVDPKDAKLTHQWLRNNVPVLNATRSTYKLTSRDAGKRMRVATTITRENYRTTTVSSAETGPVTNAGGAIPVVGAPGSVAVRLGGGNTPAWVAVPGIWSTPGTRFHYQWLRGGVPIPGEAGPIRRSPGSDEGQKIQVRITGYAPGFDPVTLTSAPQVYTRFDPIPGAVVTGGTGLGDTLTADDSVPWHDFNGRGETDYPHYYQWVRNGVPIPGATSLTYTITADDLGTALTLLTITDSFDARSNTVLVPDPDPEPVVVVELKPLTNMASPVLTGDAVAGTPMTVTTGAWSLPTEKLTYTYTWLSEDGTVIGQGGSFIPGLNHVGQKLNVLVAATAPGYMTAWVRLIADTPVTAPDPTQTRAPAASGRPMVGQEVAVSPGLWSDRDTEVKRSFQWLREGEPIAGATAAAYKAAGADLGKTLSVTVTSTLAGRTLKVQTVEVPGKVAVGTLQAGTPVISGKAVRGSVLTAAPGAWTKGAVLKYRWLRNGVTIPNAYGAKYQVRTADRNARITVKVTGTLAGYTTESRTSSAFMAR